MKLHRSGTFVSRTAIEVVARTESGFAQGPSSMAWKKFREDYSARRIHGRRVLHLAVRNREEVSFGEQMIHIVGAKVFRFEQIRGSSRSSSSILRNRLLPQGKVLDLLEQSILNYALTFPRSHPSECSGPANSTWKERNGRMGKPTNYMFVTGESSCTKRGVLAVEGDQTAD